MTKECNAQNTNWHFFSLLATQITPKNLLCTQKVGEVLWISDQMFLPLKALRYNFLGFPYLDV